jgi:hypothetical protein
LESASTAAQLIRSAVTEGWHVHHANTASACPARTVPDREQPRWRKQSVTNRRIRSCTRSPILHGCPAACLAMAGRSDRLVLRAVGSVVRATGLGTRRPSRRYADRAVHSGAWPDRRCMTTLGTPWPAGTPDYLGGKVPGGPPSPGRTSPVSYP